MTKQRKNNQTPLKFCFKCANVYTRKKGQPLFKCPECKTVQNQFKYKKFSSIAHDAFRYGYSYREVYENQFQKEGEITTFYCLAQASEYLNFIVLAVLSGIIGNFSYDIIKKVIKRIASKVCQHHLDSELINELIDNEECFNKFIKYMKDFRNGFKKVNPKVRGAILQEMSIDPVSKRTAKLIFELLNNKNISNKTYRKKLPKTIKKSLKYKVKLPTEKIKEVGPNDFDGFWSKMLVEDKVKAKRKKP